MRETPLATDPTHGDVEILQEAPGTNGASIAAVALTALFFVALAWLTLKVIGSLLHAAIAVIVCALLVLIPAKMQGSKVLRARRVIADRVAREIRVEHRGGTLTVAWSDITLVSSDPMLLSDGISLDAVTIVRRSGPSLSFSALDRAAADGIARSLRAVAGIESPPAESPPAESPPAESPPAESPPSSD